MALTGRVEQVVRRRTYQVQAPLDRDAQRKLVIEPASGVRFTLESVEPHVEHVAVDRIRKLDATDRYDVCLTISPNQATPERKYEYIRLGLSLRLDDGTLYNCDARLSIARGLREH